MQRADQFIIMRRKATDVSIGLISYVFSLPVSLTPWVHLILGILNELSGDARPSRKDVERKTH
jgi:hypothetical protein